MAQDEFAGDLLLNAIIARTIASISEKTEFPKALVERIKELADAGQLADEAAVEAALLASATD